MTFRFQIMVISIVFITSLFPQSVIRINQLGYQPDAIKVAVLMSEDGKIPNEFYIEDVFTGKVVLTSKAIKNTGPIGNFKGTARLNFSELHTNGTFKIIVGETESPNFRISDTIYNSTPDFILQYMRQQRCGYNPYLKDSCHTHDGFTVYSEDAPGNDSSQTSELIINNLYLIIAKGGWHDASDYLQYATTSATAAYQLLFAYKKNPKAFGDWFDRNGDPGANGIPDVLDEARWGLEWLDRMYPGGEEMYQQIADDRDHQMFRLPTEDSVNYGKGLYRPVYRVTGKPQGLMKFKNRSTGVASIAGKFASTMALGSELCNQSIQNSPRDFTKKLLKLMSMEKNIPESHKQHPAKHPIFMKRKTGLMIWNSQLAQLYAVTGDSKYLNNAQKYGKMEEITPWIGADTASHYQWFPFINLGHYLIAGDKSDSSDQFVKFYQNGLDKLFRSG
jgi:endoglucanase